MFTQNFWITHHSASSQSLLFCTSLLNILAYLATKRFLIIPRHRFDNQIKVLQMIVQLYQLQSSWNAGDCGWQTMPSYPWIDKKRGWAADVFNLPFKLQDSLKLISWGVLLIYQSVFYASGLTELIHSHSACWPSCLCQVPRQQVLFSRPPCQ